MAFSCTIQMASIQENNKITLYIFLLMQNQENEFLNNFLTIVPISCIIIIILMLCTLHRSWWPGKSLSIKHFISLAHRNMHKNEFSFFLEHKTAFQDSTVIFDPV